MIDENNRCKFNHESISFEGFAKVQARCLLRPVKIYGRIDEPLAKLPAPLDTLIGRPVKIDIKKLRRHLETRQISETDIGGSLDKSLSKANNNKDDAPHAKYFVIHDKSTPLFEHQDTFPDSINEPSWKHNNLKRWLEGNPKAHVFISRTGNSVSPVHFEKPWRATKFELKVLGNLGKGLFLHIELIQPRRKDLKGIDEYSPDPGFCKSQLDRLALVYLAASLRRGEWLIPAYHAVLDQGFVNAHDDPQNFDITEWAASIADLIEIIEIN